MKVDSRHARDWQRRVGDEKNRNLGIGAPVLDHNCQERNENAALRIFAVMGTEYLQAAATICDETVGICNNVSF